MTSSTRRGVSILAALAALAVGAAYWQTSRKSSSVSPAGSDLESRSVERRPLDPARETDPARTTDPAGAPAPGNFPVADELPETAPRVAAEGIDAHPADDELVEDGPPANTGDRVFELSRLPDDE